MTTQGTNLPSTDALSRENAQLREALEQEQRASHAYRDLLLAAAHEMRTPLHAIGLHLEMIALLAGSDRKEAAQIQIGRAKRVLEGYLNRTSMLLDAARINGGAFGLVRKPVALREVIATVCDLYAAKADAQKTSIEGSAPEVLGQWDRAGVETIVANLVSNALKYGEGTPVKIIAIADEGGNAVIRVADSGPGISEHQRQRIFEKFGRITTDRTVTGFGLGLWIAQQLARLHGGSITVDSTATGAAFIVTLPLGAPGASGSLA